MITIEYYIATATLAATFVFVQTEIVVVGLGLGGWIFWILIC